MSADFWHQAGNLPPIHWLLNLSLWDHAPFTWIGGILHAIFTQQALTWVEGRFAWLGIMTVVMSLLTLELIYWSWSWLRGRQINYDAYRATHWTTGPRAGQLKKKPVDIKKAIARRYAWPRLGLPLYLVALSMFTWYLLWPGSVSSQILALLWFGFAPVRRIMFIATARRAYLAIHPNDKLGTTLREDVYNYFYTGVARPASKRHDVEPPFEDTSMIYKILNWGHATFGKYGTFWRIWRFWNFLRFWGLLVEAVIAFFWPVAAVVAPFFYMSGVEDYEKWMNPWWRRYRGTNYSGKIIKGELAQDGPNQTGVSTRLDR